MRQPKEEFNKKRTDHFRISSFSIIKYYGFMYITFQYCFYPDKNSSGQYIENECSHQNIVLES